MVTNLIAGFSLPPSIGEQLTPVVNLQPEKVRQVEMVDFSAIKRVSDREYPSITDNTDHVAMVVGSMPHQFWTTISERSDVDDPYSSRPNETLQRMFERVSTAHDDEMECNCKYFSLVDKMYHLSKCNDLCRGLNRNVLHVQMNEMFTKAINARSYREQRMSVCEMAQKDRLTRLWHALDIQNKLDIERAPTGTYEWVPSIELIAAIRVEINEISEGVPLSGWYSAMAYMMHHTGRPFFSLCELERSSLVVSTDALWECPFGLRADERMAMLMSDDDYTR